jgi:hypothetical protein
VVNQIDLLAPAEQEQVRRFIEQQVKELLGLQPLLFMVSAKEALAAASNGSARVDAGGMDAVRAHLRGVFAEAPPAQQKLTAQLDTAVKIVERYLKLVQGKADLVREDTAKVREVQLELKEQSLGLDAQLKEASVEIDNVFDGLRQRGKAFIDSNLTIRKIGRSVNRDKLQAEFQDVVIGRALRDINEATTGYINAVIDQSRLYWRSVIDRLNKLQELLEQEISGLDASVYAEQRESLQDAIRIAEAELKSYSSGRVVDEIRQNFQINMNGFTTSALFAGGGLVATVLAISAPGPVLGAGAAAAASIAFVIAAPLAAVGSIAAIRYYRRISSNLKRDFEARVDRLAMTDREALDDLTRKERNRLSQYGTQTLTPIFSRLETLAQRYAEQEAEFEEYQRESVSLREDLQESSS